MSRPAQPAQKQGQEPLRSLLLFDNPDKKATRPSGDDPALPKWPFRLLLAGPPGVGKRNMILNVIFRLDPPPTSFHIVHYDTDTPEYKILEDLGVPIYYYSPADMPTAENLANPDPTPLGDTSDEVAPVAVSLPVPVAPNDKTTTDDRADDPLLIPADDTVEASPFVIIDEITAEELGKEGSARLERLMNFGSTHRNASIAISIQSLTSVPPKARRAINQYCLWKQPDTNASVMAATRAGVPPALLQELFQLCHDKHDCIWVDCDVNPDSPWRFRLNFLTPITAGSAVSTEDYA